MGNSFPFIDKINVPAARPEHLFMGHKTKRILIDSEWLV